MVLDELTKHIQDAIRWCILFGDGIVFVDGCVVIGKSLQDKIINENRRGMVGITPIEDKMRENRLRWHIYCRSVDAVVRRSDVVTVDGKD